MADSKSEYSSLSNYYVSSIVPNSSIDKDRYERSKEREANYSTNWNTLKVNLNDIVNKFIPEGKHIKKFSSGGIKYNFEGSRYRIICDKGAGYLRIYDKKAKSFCLLDGTPSRNNDLTHFKIKKREEM